jgi:hypothetical protein
MAVTTSGKVLSTSFSSVSTVSTSASSSDGGTASGSTTFSYTSSSGSTEQMLSTYYLRSTAAAEGTSSSSGSTTSTRFPATDSLTTQTQQQTTYAQYASLVSSTTFTGFDYTSSEIYEGETYTYDLLFRDFVDIENDYAEFFEAPYYVSFGVTSTSRTTTVSSGTTTNTSTTHTITSPASLQTYWFFSTGTITRPVVAVVASGTVTAMAAASIYQAEAPLWAANTGSPRHEVLYSISNFQPYYSVPVDARALAQTATRITVLPTATISEASITPRTAAGDFSTTRSSAEPLSGLLTFSQFGPNGQSSVGSVSSFSTTSSTRSASANWSYTSTASGSTTNSSLSNRGEGTTPTVSGETQRTTSTFATTGQTVIRNSSEAKALPNWNIPTSYVDQYDGTFYGTSREIYGKSGWAVNGSVGRTYTAPPGAPLAHVIGAFFTASSTAGIKVVLDHADSRFTIRGNDHTTTATTIAGEVPTTTTKTAPPGFTYTTSNTTSSYPIGVSGSLSTFGVNLNVFQDIGGFSSMIRHFGGGPFAENWTVIDKVSDAWLGMAAFSDMVNSTTTSFVGHDSSSSGGQSAPISRLTGIPYLLRGGWEGFGFLTVSNCIFWAERRNEQL